MNTEPQYTKWVACWGNATSIADRKESTYAKDLTLRYPIRLCFSGSCLRFHFSNLTGSEDVVISKAFVAKADEAEAVAITFGGNASGTIPAGAELLSDEIAFDAKAGSTINVSMYFGGFTQMASGTLVTGPLSKGFFSYGDHAASKSLPLNETRETNWFWFLNTIDILTEEKNHALICYGDSITAQSWPDYLALHAWDEGYRSVAVIRRAVCGTRILRQYANIGYLAYGLKGAVRFPIEAQAAGADAVIIQHGINDIIHPVGVESNKFRPWSDLPSADELSQGIETLYVACARKMGLKVWSGTLLPIMGWRTYMPMRDELRNKVNEWLRTSPVFDGCVDFDAAVRDPQNPLSFAPGFDSGDHLHPSESAYKAMAEAVPAELLK